jgi:tRNA (guanine-N7-)-methyltransferase
MVGCEPYINGVGKLLGHIEDKQLKNVRIHADDARPLLDALPDGSVSRLFILFADPWPKKRHAERRFVGPANLPRLARVLKPGAEMRLASDDEPLVAHMLKYVLADGRFKWLAEGCKDWDSRPADWPPTRYEQKELHGKPVFLRFQRI